MNPRLIEFLCSVGVASSIFLLGLIGRVIIGGYSDTLSEVDWVIPDQLALFSLSLTSLAFFAYSEIPKSVCPAVFHKEFGISAFFLFGGILFLEFVLFMSSLITKAVILREEDSYEKRGWIFTSWRAFYRNFFGLFSVMLIIFLLSFGRI